MTVQEMQDKIAALVAENQALGAQVDALRERRRAINAEVAKLNDALRVLGAIGATAPGSTVEVSAADMLRGMLAAVEPKRVQ
jgi:prefoldin subunit 5